jgi:hypothetical protein
MAEGHGPAAASSSSGVGGVSSGSSNASSPQTTTANTHNNGNNNGSSNHNNGNGNVNGDGKERVQDLSHTYVNREAVAQLRRSVSLHGCEHLIMQVTIDHHFIYPLVLPHPLLQSSNNVLFGCVAFGIG